MIFTEMLLQNSGFPTAYLTFYIPSAKSGMAACKKMSAMLLLFQSRLLNSAIRKLEQEGYLTLSNGKGHSKHIHLTESGHTLLKETIFPIVEAENEAFTELSFEECNLLLKLHSKYTTALREKFSKL